MGMVFGTMKVAEGAFQMLQWKNLKAYNSSGNIPTQRQHSRTQTYLNNLCILKGLPFPQSFRQNRNGNSDLYFSCVISSGGGTTQPCFSSVMEVAMI